MNCTPLKLVEVADAAGFDLVKFEKDPNKHEWSWDDIDAEKGIRKAVRLGVNPDKTLDTTYDGVRVKVEGWCITDGLWIGRYKSRDKYTKRWEPWNYCNGQDWSDIWQG